MDSLNGKCNGGFLSTKSAEFCYNGSILGNDVLEAGTKNLVFLLFFVCGLALLGFALQQFFSPRIVIEWKTASELDTVGFNILRAESSDGTPVKINQSLISPSDDPLTGGSYQYEDRDVKVGATYYYYLEDLDAQGNTNLNGPEIVTAAPSGLLESGLAVLLCIVSVIGFVRSRQQTGERNGA